MVQMRSILEVADNSGAKRIAMILPLGGNTGSRASLGDVITASVKEASPDGTVKKKQVVKAVIVRTRQGGAPQGRHLHPLRPERRRVDQARRRARRHTRVRPRGARIARTRLYEDREPRS